MTVIGLTILDLFFQSLNYKLPYGKPVLSERNLRIVRGIYDCENSRFNKPEDLADEFNVTGERIRQIYTKALLRVGALARKNKDTFPGGKILRIIEKHAKLLGNDNNIHSSIISLWYYELRDFPCRMTLRLLSSLYFSSTGDINITLGHLPAWKKRQWDLRHEAYLANIRRRTRIKEEKQFNELLENVIWFDHITTRQKEDFLYELPKRQVNRNTQYYSGEYWSKKCNRNVQHESAKELEFIHTLESSPQVSYYLEQPVTIEYIKWDVERCYTPDFLVLLKSGKCVLVERKDLDGMVDATVHRRMEALMDYCKEKGYGILITNGKYSINHLRKYPYNLDLETDLRNILLEKGEKGITYYHYKILMDKHKAKKVEFLSIVLNNNWNYYPYPFRLTPNNIYPRFRERIL
jgi:hypothetical protein